MEEFKIHVHSPPTGRMLIHMLTFYMLISLDPIYIGVKSTLNLPHLIKYLSGVIPKIGIKNNTISIHNTKYMDVDGDIGVQVKGSHFEELYTDDGRQILTQNGDSIIADAQSDDVVAHLTKYTSPSPTKFAVKNNDISATMVEYTEVSDKFAVKNNTISVSEQKFADIDSEIGVASYGSYYHELYTDSGIQILTQDGQPIIAEVVGEVVDVHLTKYTSGVESTIGVGLIGSHFLELATDDGEDILTQSGENIIADVHDDDIDAHLTKFAEPDENGFAVGNSDIDTCTISYTEVDDSFAVNNNISSTETKYSNVDSKIGVDTYGSYYLELYTDNGQLILTQDGDSIIADVKGNEVDAHLTKYVTNIENTIAAGVIGSNFAELFTDNGYQILTQSGEEIIADVHSENVMAHLIMYTTPVNSDSINIVAANLSTSVRRLRLFSEVPDKLMETADMTMQDFYYIEL